MPILKKTSATLHGSTIFEPKAGLKTAQDSHQTRFCTYSEPETACHQTRFCTYSGIESHF